MLFDPAPKENPPDLFDREEELRTLGESIRLREKLIVIYGVRRVGKTSLLHVFLNEKKVPYLLVDIRGIYSENGYISLPAICEAVIEEFDKFLKRIGLEESIFDSSCHESLTKTLKSINEWSISKKVDFIIAFDEAQYLRLGGKTKYDGIIAWSMDNLHNIGFILTGSEVGMLKDFLNYEDTSAMLYGRLKTEIVLERFESEKSKQFLRKGFKEQKLKIKETELDNAVINLDGTAGWLTYYGYYRGVRKLPHNKAMESVYKEGSRIVMEEVNRLLSKSRGRYISLLKAIAEDICSWAEIKRYVTAKSGRIPDTRLSHLLESLIKFGFVEKTENEYKIIDPMLLHEMKKLRL